MKTTVDIPDEELRSLTKYTGKKRKKDAINVAVREFNRRARCEELADKRGKFSGFFSNKELSHLRESE